ncbi:MAG: translation initiation factor IF-5A, partial [Candidatus Poseidoniales archaeon]
MPGTSRVEIRTLKIGRYVAIDDDAFKILSMSKSKPGKHGSAKARIELENIFTGQKKSHVGTVTDNIQVPMIEKGSAIITHIQGNEVHAMDNKT